MLIKDMEIRITGKKEEIEIIKNKYLNLPNNSFTISRYYQNGNTDEFRIYINIKSDDKTKREM